jgi:hypothetical protein
VLYNRTKGRYKNRAQQSNSSSNDNNEGKNAPYRENKNHPGRGRGASGRRQQPPPQQEIPPSQPTKRRPKYDESLLLLDTHQSRYYPSNPTPASDDMVAISILNTAGGSTVDLQSMAATLETMPLAKRLDIPESMARVLDHGSSTVHIMESQSTDTVEDAIFDKEVSLQAALSLENDGQSLASLKPSNNQNGLDLALAGSNDTDNNLGMEEADSIQSDLAMSPLHDQQMRMEQDPTIDDDDSPRKRLPPTPNNRRLPLLGGRQGVMSKQLPADPSQHAALMKSDSYSVANARVSVLPNGEVEVRDNPIKEGEDSTNDMTDSSVRIDHRGNVEVRQKLITLALSDTTEEDDDIDEDIDDGAKVIRSPSRRNPNLPDHLISPYRRNNDDHRMTIMPNISEASMSIRGKFIGNNDPAGIRMSYSETSAHPDSASSYPSGALSDDPSSSVDDRYHVNSTYTASSSEADEEPIEATLEKIEKVKQKLSIIDKSYHDYDDDKYKDTSKKSSSKKNKSVEVSAPEAGYLEDWLDDAVKPKEERHAYEDTQHAKIHEDSSYDDYSESNRSGSISTLTRTTAPTKSTHVVGSRSYTGTSRGRGKVYVDSDDEKGNGGGGDDNLDDWLDTVIS